MAVTKLIKASSQKIYETCLDPAQLVLWRAPDQMTGKIHSFEAKVNGRYRMSLIYNQDSGDGKSSATMDTFTGEFLELIPNKKIVEQIEFETADKKFAGKMKMITSLSETKEGTLVTMDFEDLPAGIRPEDNDEGTRQSLQKLARLVE